MEGSTSHPGVIRRSVQHVMDSVAHTGTEVSVKVSFLASRLIWADIVLGVGD
jgi:hypothetical protein